MNLLLLRLARQCGFATLMVLSLNVSVAQKVTNPVSADNKPLITGELMKWHKVTLTFDGPRASETDDNNPFLNYRLNVLFTHKASGKSYLVPGYFAADGNAGETSVTAGDKWRVHFAPDVTGT